MKRRLLVLFAISIGQSAAQPSLRPYEQTLDRWQQRTGVAIEPKAKQKLVGDATESQPMVRREFQSGKSTDPTPLIQQLLRHYCFDIRDRKLSRQVQHAALPFALGFQPLPSGIKITQEDVTQFTFFDFIRSFLSGQSPQLVGYLEVQSEKPTSEIRIEGRMRGYTNRSLVMSVGSYKISILHQQLSCTDRPVAIREGATATLKCPQ